MAQGELIDVEVCTALVAEGSCAPEQVGPEISRLVSRLMQAYPDATLVDAPRIYYLEWRPDQCRIQAALPIEAGSPESGSDNVKTFPATTAFFTTYTGPYEGLAAAWADLWAEATKLALTSGGAPWDRYVAGPDQESDPTRWITELYLPVQISRLT